MDPEGLNAFQEAIGQCSCFLEYGTGGSTICAARTANVKHVISVDSAPEWIGKVREALGASNAQLQVLHCDIGEVSDWGRPINRSRSKNFWNYMVTPWRKASELNLVPDLVLNDGRFRVASFLYSLLSARIGTKILFDDYFDRPCYFVVEKYCKVSSRHGRMACFYVDKQFSVPELAASCAEYSNDWR